MSDTSHQKGTFNNGAEPFRFFQKAKVLDDAPCVKKSHQWSDYNRAGHIRMLMGIEDTSTVNPEKGRAGKRKIKYCRPSERHVNR